MIVQDIFLRRYDWTIRAYYIVDAIDKSAIINDLLDIHCEPKDLERIEMLLDNLQYNEGLTYTSFVDNSTITVIGPTTSGEEFQNTFDHEKGHIAMHIATALGIEPLGEPYQYLTGAIGREMYKIAKRFLCDKCRSHTSDLFSLHD